LADPDAGERSRGCDGGDFEAFFGARAAVDCATEAASDILLQAFYSIRRERQLMDYLAFDLLSPWFVGLGSMMGYGIIQHSRRTGTACWRVK
jgi:transposase